MCASRCAHMSETLSSGPKNRFFIILFYQKQREDTPSFTKLLISQHSQVRIDRLERSEAVGDARELGVVDDVDVRVDRCERVEHAVQRRHARRVEVTDDLVMHQEKKWSDLISSTSS